MNVDKLFLSNEEVKFWDQAFIKTVVALVPKVLSVRPESGEDAKCQINLMVLLAAQVVDTMLAQRQKKHGGVGNVTI